MPLEKRIVADGKEFYLTEFDESFERDASGCVLLRHDRGGWWRIYRNGGKEYTPHAETLPPEPLQRALEIWVKAGAEYGDCTLMDFLTKMGVASEVRTW